MLVNEYKPEFLCQNGSKDGNLGNVYICGLPFDMSRTNVQNGLYCIFNYIYYQFFIFNWTGSFSFIQEGHIGHFV